MIDLFSLLGGTATDLVAIFDDDTGQQLFKPASPMRVSVQRNKKITRFEVEDGGQRTDHMVIELTEITLDFILNEDTKNAYAAFRDAWQGNKLVTVQTKVDSFPSMLIETLPHEEAPDLGAAVAVPIRFVEWKPTTPETSDKVADPKQSKTKNRGQQQTTETPAATKKKGSILHGMIY